jgi:hypothetical protein
VQDHRVLFHRFPFLLYRIFIGLKSPVILFLLLSLPPNPRHNSSMDINLDLPQFVVNKICKYTEEGLLFQPLFDFKNRDYSCFYEVKTRRLIISSYFLSFEGGTWREQLFNLAASNP